MGETYALELRAISKRFGSVQANDHVDLTLRKSEILAILGENGSGKTTLMNMIYGIYYPDEGHILVNGQEVKIRSPKDSYELGIGMVHQHFKLVDVLTAAENIVLGLPGKARLNMKKITEDIQKLVNKYGFDLDLTKKIYEMSVSEKQTVEIVKMLYRGARILILDEPTAVLTPQEADRLFDILRNMRDDGCAIIIITHKLQEVLALSDRVAILRKGKYIDTVETAQAKEFVDKTEGGVDAFVAQGGSNFSGGQKQRLSIARAICRRPEILIFDDSFSALDYKTDRVLRDTLRKTCADATRFIVAQRIGTIRDADKIIVLDDGKIAGMGKHNELMETCEVYRQIAYSQLSKEELA